MFRNLRVWQLDAPLSLAGDQLAEALEGARFSPCAPGQAETIGLDPVLDGVKMLTREVAGATFLRVRHQERALPSAAVAEILREKAAEIAAREGSEPRGARRRELADEIRHDLMRTAPLVSSWQWVCIDPEQGLVMVDTATASRGEAVLSVLRGALGSLPLRPLAFARPLDGVLTAWLASGDLPPAFALGEWCDLEHPQDTRNKVRFRGQPLDEDEVVATLDRGLRVTALELFWHDDQPEPMRFVLSEDAALRRVRVPWEYGGDLEVETAMSRLDADLALSVLSMRRLFEVLFPALGGRAVE